MCAYWLVIRLNGRGEVAATGVFLRWGSGPRRPAVVGIVVVVLLCWRGGGVEGHTNSLGESPRFLEFDVKANVVFETGDKTTNQVTVGTERSLELGEPSVPLQGNTVKVERGKLYTLVGINPLEFEIGSGLGSGCRQLAMVGSVTGAMGIDGNVGSEKKKPQLPSFTPFNVTMNDVGTSKSSYKWRRVLLKVSGEVLAGDQAQNIDPKVTMAIAREVAAVTRLGIEVAIVVGGGNIFRGSSWAGCSGLDRSSADYIGRAVRHLEKGRVVIFAAGTGNPFFTTDTAAALRCAEKVMLKGTNVDGVYSDNPKHNPNASLLETATYQEVISRDLSVMDMTAITLCQENNIPVVVFNLNEPGNIANAIIGERVGTLIGGHEQLVPTRSNKQNSF
ncbi:amino acid kinase family protein [Actinidia rufa]|uniref:UMP kinase n=1 Tax=Actinidia rufa TaxID=165716 RepID=A0A7J0EXU7_9ERIC|nr:amino acid kinase family protein [Actinidia rufa]